MSTFVPAVAMDAEVSPRISEYLQDPAWWFSAVITGVVVSVCGNLVTPYLGKARARVSAKYWRRREARDVQFQALVKEYKQSSQRLYLAALEELRLRMQALSLFLAAVLCFGVGLYGRDRDPRVIWQGFMLMGLLSTCLTMWLVAEASRLSQAVRRANEPDNGGGDQGGRSSDASG